MQAPHNEFKLLTKGFPRSEEVQLRRNLPMLGICTLKATDLLSSIALSSRGEAAYAASVNN